MQKNIDNINFDAIDLSEFAEEINEIREDIEDLKKNKKIMKKLQKIKLNHQINTHNIFYNNTNKSTKNCNILNEKVLIEEKDAKNEYDNIKGMPLYY